MHLTLVGPGRIGIGLLPMLQSEGHQVTVLSRNEYGDFLAPTYAPSDAVSQLTACDAALILAGCFELNAAFARMVQVNALGPARVANAIHGRFPYAHIITFLDSRIGRPKTALPLPVCAYLASKRRFAHWTLAAARCWGRKTGTRVNAIAPGPVLPPPNPDHREKAGPCLTPRPSVIDIHSAVAFLLRTPSVTGQILYVDAGQHLLQD